MSLTITGKNFDIGDALRSQVETTIGATVGKYFDGGFGGHVVIEHDGPGYRCDATLHLDTGVTLEASGMAMEATFAFDQAAGRIEKRLRRYKRRLRDHDHSFSMGGPTESARSAVIASPAGEDEVPVDYNPVIVAEGTTDLRTLTVAGAVLAMDLSGAPVLVFRNAGSGGVNVVYRRSDGNIGWIDPTFSPKWFPGRGFLERVNHPSIGPGRRDAPAGRCKSGPQHDGSERPHHPRRRAAGRQGQQQEAGDRRAGGQGRRAHRAR